MIRAARDRRRSAVFRSFAVFLFEATVGNQEQISEDKSRRIPVRQKVETPKIRAR